MSSVFSSQDQFCPFWDQFCGFASGSLLRSYNTALSKYLSCFKIFIFLLLLMACKIKSKLSSLEFDQNNTSVKPSSIANSASKGGIRNFITSCWFPILPFCCCSFGTKKICRMVMSIKFSVKQHVNHFPDHFYIDANQSNISKS